MLCPICNAFFFFCKLFDVSCSNNMILNLNLNLIQGLWKMLHINSLMSEGLVCTSLCSYTLMKPMVLTFSLLHCDEYI